MHILPNFLGSILWKSHNTIERCHMTNLDQFNKIQFHPNQQGSTAIVSNSKMSKKGQLNRRSKQVAK